MGGKGWEASHALFLQGSGSFNSFILEVPLSVVKVYTTKSLSFALALIVSDIHLAVNLGAQT